MSSNHSDKDYCKYFYAGFCSFGDSCRNTHDLQLMEEVEKEWFNEELSLLWTQDGVKNQSYQYLAVLDLEGKEEIIEFPVIVLDTTTLEVAGRFHRWVKPVRLFEEQAKIYPRGQTNNQSSAKPFSTVLTEFHQWMNEHKFADSVLFVTCGDWDLRKQVPRQCGISCVWRPPYLDHWVNIKELFNQHNKSRRGVRGMRGLLNKLGLPLEGKHHLGMHDVNNICRCLAAMLDDGIVATPTFTRSVCSLGPSCRLKGACQSSHPEVFSESPTQPFIYDAGSADVYVDSDGQSDEEKEEEESERRGGRGRGGRGGGEGRGGGGGEGRGERGGRGGDAPKKKKKDPLQGFSVEDELEDMLR